MRAGGSDAPIILVVPAGLGKAFADARVPDAELILLAGRRWQSVLPQWSTGPFSRPPGWPGRAGLGLHACSVPPSRPRGSGNPGLRKQFELPMTRRKKLLLISFYFF